MPRPPRALLVAPLLLAGLLGLREGPAVAGDEPPAGAAPDGAPAPKPAPAPQDAPPPPDAGKAPAKDAPVEPTKEQLAAWGERLARLAAGYRSLARVDDMSRWAPELCWRPMRVSTPMSASDDEATHGKKLFAVWAKDVASYGALSGLHLTERDPAQVDATPGAEACSQVIVKEAFEAVEMKPDEQRAPGALAPAEHDGKRYRTGAPHGLFVMFRLDPTTPGTDDGWVYGTLDPKGAVTAVGRVASCMKCHVEAPHGRLFGLPKDTVK